VAAAADGSAVSVMPQLRGRRGFGLVPRAQMLIDFEKLAPKAKQKDAARLSWHAKVIELPGPPRGVRAMRAAPVVATAFGPTLDEPRPKVPRSIATFDLERGEQTHLFEVPGQVTGFRF